MTTGAGRCLCGAVRYKFDPSAVLWTAFCHCESCRRATASPVAAYFGVRASAWRWHGKAPKRHRSSPGVTRSFCGDCGSPLAYESTRWPDEIHGFTASLAAPEALPPRAHVFHGERLAWFETADDLPRHPGTSDD